MKSVTRILAAALITLIAIWPIACSTSEVAALVQTLGNAGASVAALEGNTAVADKLKIDTAAAVAAVTNWKSGSPAQEAIQALTIVEDDLNLIPVASQYAPLVDLAIGTVESLLALLPPPTIPFATVNVDPLTGDITAKVRRSVALKTPAPKTAKDFKKQWNALAPPAARIK